MVTRYDLRWNPDLAWLQIDVVPREGLYSIVVRAPGYQDWVRERVQYLPAPTTEVPCPKWLELVAEMTRP